MLTGTRLLGSIHTIRTQSIPRQWGDAQTQQTPGTLAAAGSQRPGGGERGKDLQQLLEETTTTPTTSSHLNLNLCPSLLLLPSGFAPGFTHHSIPRTCNLVQVQHS